MRPATRILAVVASFAALLSILTGVVTPAARAAGNNESVAINTKDGTTVFSVHLQITRVNGDVVDASNTAVAYASCTDCEAVAIAFQAVLVSGDPSVIDPSNVAIAVNSGCNNCTTLADAYQQIVLTGGKAHFTPDGKKELNSIKHQLHELRRADLSPDQLVAEVDQLQADFANVLANDIVVDGHGGNL
jgi:putative peptide zinc metalloprotease protein